MTSNVKLAAAALACLLLAGPVAISRAEDKSDAQPAAAKESHAAPNTLSDKEKKAGFRLLFDGHSTDNFRGYKMDQVKGWEAVDGALKRVDPKAPDLITREQFGAFELLIDYKISKGGNSGIMFHVAETDGPSYVTGPEIQVQDNVDGHDPQKSGWLYQLYHPDFDATKPAGEWNHLRILIAPNGKKSEVDMNGKKYYEFVIGSDDWNQRVARSKFKDMPGFGKQAKGYICLQNHGDEVEYRNIKIRVIDGTSARK